MEYRTRKMIKHADLNPAGTLFGGRALEWIDEEAAIFAYCQLKYPGHLVTKAMSAIDFKAPAHRGEIVEIGTETVKVGTTSITIAISLRNKQTQQEIVRVDGIVFVNLGEDGKPKPHNVYTNSGGKVETKNEIVENVNLQVSLQLLKSSGVSPVEIMVSGIDVNGNTIHGLNNYGMGKERFEDDCWT